MPSRGGRTSSGPWGRLKAIDQDPLASIGLPSKGDLRLLDVKEQERYYTKIVERYMTFCSDAGEPTELLRRFATVHLDDRDDHSATAAQPPSAITTDVDSRGDSTRALAEVLAALRKLREGIVAARRVDEFAVQAYLFCIRLAVLVQHPPTYHPAILHVLRAFQPRGVLTTVELREVATFLVLDAACRRRDLADAYAVRAHWRLHDPKLNAALQALAHDNYVAFARIHRNVDSHRARLMELAAPSLRAVALRCFGRAYLSVDLPFLERCTGRSWDQLRERDGVGWELDRGRVVIRRVRRPK